MQHININVLAVCQFLIQALLSLTAFGLTSWSQLVVGSVGFLSWEHSRRALEDQALSESGRLLGLILRRPPRCSGLVHNSCLHLICLLLCNRGLPSPFKEAFRRFHRKCTFKVILNMQRCIRSWSHLTLLVKRVIGKSVACSTKGT